MSIVIDIEIQRRLVIVPANDISRKIHFLTTFPLHSHKTHISHETNPSKVPSCGHDADQLFNTLVEHFGKSIEFWINTYELAIHLRGGIYVSEMIQWVRKMLSIIYTPEFEVVQLESYEEMIAAETK